MSPEQRWASEYSSTTRTSCVSLEHHDWVELVRGSRERCCPRLLSYYYLSSARVSLGVESKSLRDSISNRRGTLYCCRAWYTSSAEDGRATHGEINCDINIEFIGSEGHPFARLRPRGLRMPRAVSRGRASSDAPTYFPRSGVAPRHGPGTSSSFFPKCPLRRCTFRTNINYFRRGAAHEFSATADRDRALDNAASAPLETPPCRTCPASSHNSRLACASPIALASACDLCALFFGPIVLRALLQLCGSRGRRAPTDRGLHTDRNLAVFRAKSFYSVVLSIMDGEGVASIT